MTPDDIRRLNMKDALDQCSTLSDADARQLIESCAPTDHRVLFALKVASQWVIPTDLNNGLVPLTSNKDGNGGIGDFGEARTFIMKQREKSPGDARAKKPKDAAWTSWFYPEYKKIAGLRDRFVQVASDHAGLDFNDMMQANLFSLNGFFNWQQAQSSAHTFTTCGLFVRACRAAARVLEQKDWTTGTPQGTDPCITGQSPQASAIPYSRRGSLLPKAGDIFHVADLNVDETTGAVTTGRDHVGIIVRADGSSDGDWHWATVEGGQGKGFLTRSFDRTLVLDKDGKRYHGEGAFRRPLIKWIDLDKLASAIASSP